MSKIIPTWLCGPISRIRLRLQGARASIIQDVLHIANEHKAPIYVQNLYSQMRIQSFGKFCLVKSLMFFHCMNISEMPYWSTVIVARIPSFVITELKYSANEVDIPAFCVIHIIILHWFYLSFAVEFWTSSSVEVKSKACGLGLRHKFFNFNLISVSVSLLAIF